MNGKQRIMTALSGGRPDVVPVWELAFNEESIIKIAGNFMDDDQLPEPKSIWDMTDEETFQVINGFSVMGRELGLDGFCATAMVDMETLDDDHFKDPFGVVHHKSQVGEPFPVQGPIDSLRDLNNYKMRSPQEEDYLLLDVMRSQFPDSAVSYMMSGPYFMSWCLRGAMEKLLMDYILAPDLVHGLARMTTDYCLESLEIIADKGADFVVMECDLAFINNTMMSVGQYREYIGPYHKQIVDKGHQLGLKMVKHSDGKLLPFVPEFIEEGFDGLHPIQPQCMDIGETKATFGNDLCVMGNIDCAYLLVFGDPEEVRESVRKTIAAAAPGGGYIISSSNTIHPGVKPENYIALVRAAREFGHYPELAGD